MNTIKFLTILLGFAALYGCGQSEQTTDADVKAAMANQKPDPNAAAASSPMAGLKGKGAAAPGKS